MMGRKIPDHYVVRRPLTLFGEQRSIGDVITRSEAASLTRVESLVRAGRLDEVFEPIEEVVAPVKRGRKPKIQSE